MTGEPLYVHRYDGKKIKIDDLPICVSLLGAKLPIADAPAANAAAKVAILKW